jgi:hypothetical protein
MAQIAWEACKYNDWIWELKIYINGSKCEDGYLVSI